MSVLESRWQLSTTVSGADHRGRIAKVVKRKVVCVCARGVSVTRNIIEKTAKMSAYKNIHLVASHAHGTG